MLIRRFITKRERAPGRTPELHLVEERRNVLGMVKDTNHLDGCSCWSVEDGEGERGQDGPPKVAVRRVRGGPELAERGEGGQPFEDMGEVAVEPFGHVGVLVVEVLGVPVDIVSGSLVDDEIKVGHARLRGCCFLARSRRCRAR